MLFIRSYTCRFQQAVPYDAQPPRSQILLGSLFGVLNGLVFVPFGIDVVMWIAWFNVFKDQTF